MTTREVVLDWAREHGYEVVHEGSYKIGGLISQSMADMLETQRDIFW